MLILTGMTRIFPTPHTPSLPAQLPHTSLRMIQKRRLTRDIPNLADTQAAPLLAMRLLLDTYPESSQIRKMQRMKDGRVPRRTALTAFPRDWTHWQLHRPSQAIAADTYRGDEAYLLYYSTFHFLQRSLSGSVQDVFNFASFSLFTTFKPCSWKYQEYKH